MAGQHQLTQRGLRETRRRRETSYADVDASCRVEHERWHCQPRQTKVQPHPAAGANLQPAAAEGSDVADHQFPLFHHRAAGMGVRSVQHERACSTLDDRANARATA